jgi:hypothetical protein
MQLKNVAIAWHVELVSSCIGITINLEEYLILGYDAV